MSVEQRLSDLEARIVKLEKEAADGTTAKPPRVGDKHYQICKDVFEILSKHHLLVHEAYTVLEQVKSVIGYTPIRQR